MAQQQDTWTAREAALQALIDVWENYLLRQFPQQVVSLRLFVVLGTVVAVSLAFGTRVPLAVLDTFPILTAPSFRRRLDVCQLDALRYLARAWIGILQSVPTSEIDLTTGLPRDQKKCRDLYGASGALAYELGIRREELIKSLQGTRTEILGAAFPVPPRA